jgi:hypothetical protein
VDVGGGRWCFSFHSSLTCEVMVGHGGHRWRVAEACRLVTGESRRQVAVRVMVELLLPPSFR